MLDKYKYLVTLSPEEYLLEVNRLSKKERKELIKYMTLLKFRRRY